MYTAVFTYHLLFAMRLGANLNDFEDLEEGSTYYKFICIYTYVHIHTSTMKDFIAMKEIFCLCFEKLNALPRFGVGVDFCAYLKNICSNIKV